MSIQQVIDVLDRMDELYRGMIALGEQKKQAIMNDDVELLTKVMSKETRLIKQAAELDEEREQAIALFLKDKGIRSQLSLNITELTRLVFDLTEKHKLQEAQGRLAGTLLDLKQLNGISKELLEQSLTFIDYSLNLFISEPEDGMLYRNPADQSAGQKKPRSFFDTRA